MGCLYNRGTRARPNFWIKFRDAAGKTCYRRVGPDRTLAKRVLAKIEGDVVAGRAGLPPEPRAVSRLAELADEWLERRKVTHRAFHDDICRWNKHLKPFLGTRAPGEVDAAAIRRFVEAKLGEGLNSATVGHCVRLLSTFYADLVERGVASANPVQTLPRSTRRLCRPTNDPRRTPFVEKIDDVRRIYLALPGPINVAFAVGAFAGLRTGEVLALDWRRDIDLDGRRLNAQCQASDGRLAPLKDDESRVVPIQKPLLKVLSAWRLRSGGAGLLFPPANPRRGGRPYSPPRFMRPQTLHRHLRAALKACELPSLTWYQATRHTFASHWVLSGGSIEKLAVIMGHSSVVVTERYAHLRPDLFREDDYERLDVSLEIGEVVEMTGRGRKAGHAGYAGVTRAVRARGARQASH